MKNIGTNLSGNKKYIKYVLGESPDITIREFIIPALNNCDSFFVCIDGLVNSNEIDNTILEALVKYKGIYKEADQNFSQENIQDICAKVQKESQGSKTAVGDSGEKQNECVDNSGENASNRDADKEDKAEKENNGNSDENINSDKVESDNNEKGGKNEENEDGKKSGGKENRGEVNKDCEDKSTGEKSSNDGDSQKLGGGGNNRPAEGKEIDKESEKGSDNSQKGKNSDEGSESSKDNQVSDKINYLTKLGVLVPSLKTSSDWNEILDAVVSGDTALFLEGEGMALILSTRGFSSRSVSEPTVESEVRASKDAFNENIRTNTSLIRRRIKDYSLRIENMKIGERTKTDVSVAYIDNLVDKAILGELKSRLQRIRVDSILESGYLEEYISDQPYSLFPLIEHTERPDKASAAILEGRIAVIVDNTPFVLMVPTIFWQYIQAVGDYTESFFIGTFMRILRLFCLFLSLTASSFYVMLVAFHQEMLPTDLALRVAAGREGVPFPAVMEALIMEFMFEIMREAGLRLPKPVGQAVSIVGTLVIGEAAVNAGLVGPTLVIAIAASGISSFAIPAYNTSFALRLVKFPLIILSGTFGILGFLGGTIAITMNLLSLRSFGAPFMTPISPYRSRGNKDTFIRVPWWRMNKRPETGKPQDSARQSGELKPEPPKAE